MITGTIVESYKYNLPNIKDNATGTIAVMIIPPSKADKTRTA